MGTRSIRYEVAMARFSDAIGRVLNDFDSIHPLLEFW